ncbi:hypothetical protein B0181_07980 [Moraxella caviae]|uniref:DNA topoisomerase n=1 Tax=Moraxella caviae TaxID=34060 RepID=A0A1S9ZYS0_9GAMM|nr:type IA DNA topoisomerase [Moraxella caviae]OOR88646.1 hypothetical protein B0181_07980 [Moraxella caviae]STZ13670.1 DNA topoisomerase 1 [Moraxella caviae]
MTAKTLVIVESSKKAKTIEGILGADYKVIASGGHIRDMTKDGLGFDKQSLNIEYVMTGNNKEWVKKIKNVLDRGLFSHVILAADPDREGEAIAQSLKDELGLNDTNSSRATFNEITESAINKAIKESKGGKINRQLVDAQETRRILDRYVGWECTAAVSAHNGRKMPVGRVQSQAVRFIVQRDQEIVNFDAKEHYKVSVKSKTGMADDNTWTAKLDLKMSELGEIAKHKGSETRIWTDQQAADNLVKHIKAGGIDLKLVSQSEKQESSKPPAPFITSTLHQSAWKKLKLRGKKVDEIAQSLYQEGYITYPRTDNANMSDEKFAMLQAYGISNGLSIVKEKRVFSNKKSAQEAHEAILPTDLNAKLTFATDEHRALYEMIKDRAIMSQLEDKIYTKRDAVFELEYEGKKYFFKASGVRIISQGWAGFGKDLTSDDDELTDSLLPVFDDGQSVEIADAEYVHEKTAPPPHLNQASLNKLLDDEGIGRPSTYSKIYEKILQHKYIQEDKNNAIMATELARRLVACTCEIYSIMDPKFTKQMEDKLDSIAQGELNKADILYAFFDEIDKNNQSVVALKAPDDLHHCQKPDCDGVLIMDQYKHKDGGMRDFWRCNDCAELYWSSGGKPFNPDLDILQYLNEDGSPKHPCKQCGSALKRITSSKNNKEYWVCSGNAKASDDKSDCGVLADFEGAPDYENNSYAANFAENRKQQMQARLEKHLASKAEKHTCAICEDHLVPGKTVEGKYMRWDCVGCYASYYHSLKKKDDGKVHKFNPESVFEWRFAAILSDDRKSVRIECPDCQGALNLNKDKSEVVCTGIWAKKTTGYCGFNKLSPDEKEKLVALDDVERILLR